MILRESETMRQIQTKKMLSKHKEKKHIIKEIKC